MQGLLKVRGELKKSDVVATTLAIQSLQQLVADARPFEERLYIKRSKKDSKKARRKGSDEETREQQKVFEARVLRVLADLSS